MNDGLPMQEFPLARRTTLAILVALIAVHIALAATLASITPFRTAGALFTQFDPRTHAPQKVPDIGAPDERQHVNYIARLVHGGGFPVLKVDANLGETYQSHQPPAYYLLAAGWATVTGTYLPPEPPASEGKEMTQSDGLKLRSLNVIIGSITVAGVFFLCFWAYRKPEAALVAAAFAALLPMNAGLSGAVSNDPLLICLCTWTLALCIKAIREGWTAKLAFSVGLLAALAVVTKTTGAVLLPIVLVAAFLPKDGRATVKQIGFALVPFLVLVLPWWVRNQSLYGDPLAMGAFNRAFTGSPQAKDFIAGMGFTDYWRWVASWTSASFIGVFGYMDVWLTNNGIPSGANSIYQVGWLVILVAFAGWILSLRKTSERPEKQAHLLNGAFFLAVLASFLLFNNHYFQAQARYLLPALGPVACGIGLGLYTICQERWKIALAIVVLAFGFAAAFAVAKLPTEFDHRIEMAKRLP